jgi:hypothetical protein
LGRCETGYEDGRVSGRDEKTLADVFADLWQARVFVFTGAFLGLLAATGFITVAVPHYRAQMIISPASPMNGAEISSLLAEESLFPIRALVQRAGITNSADFTRFETTYARPSVAALMLKDSRVAEGVAQERDFSFSAAPNVEDAEHLAAYIEKHVRLESVGATPQRKLVYAHPDRTFAAYFLHRLHKVTDELIRQKLRQEAEQRIRHLQQAITETANPEHRRNLTSLLMEQERLRMLVSIETPYAASVIEPPAADIKASWPDAALLFPAFIFAGALAGFVIVGIAGLARVSTPVKARTWFPNNKSNSNTKPSQRPLTARDAAE